MSESLAGGTRGVATALSLNLVVGLGGVEGMSIGEGEQVVHIVRGSDIRDTISRGNTSELNVGLTGGVSFQDAISEGGDVDTGIRLSSNVELVLSILREVSKPLDEELEGIIGGTSIVSVEVVRGGVRVRETDSSRALKVEHVGNTSPAIRILDESGIIARITSFPGERSVLIQETVQRRATRSSVQP